MLRALVLLLVLAHVALWGYPRQWWAGLGWSQPVVHEPARLQAQHAPERMALVAPPPPEPSEVTPAPAAPTAAEPEGPAAAAPATPTPTAPTGAAACWQYPGLGADDRDALKTLAVRLETLAPGWGLSESAAPPRWIIYVGPFANREAMQKRKTELREANVNYREVKADSLRLGLALGTFPTEDVALRGLRMLSRVKDAKVVAEPRDAKVYVLRLPAVSTAALEQVKALEALKTHTPEPCAAP